MGIISTFVEYIGVGNYRGKRGVQRDDVSLIDSFQVFNPETLAALNAIKLQLPVARGLATAANSLSINSSTDRPLDVRENASEGNGTLAITTAIGNGFSIDVSRLKRFSIQINNTGAVALNAFEIATKSSSTSDTRVRNALAASYSTLDTKGSLISIGGLDGVFVQPTTLSGGAKIILDFNLTGFFVREIRFRATTTTGTTNLDYLWGGI